MKLRSSVFTAAALALGLSGTAMANGVVENVSVVNMNAAFTAVHTDNLSFQDVFTFNVAGNVLASVSGITIALLPQQDIDFTSATLNGQALTLTTTPGGSLEAFFSPVALNVTGPLVLTITGTAHAGAGINASYAGTLNIAAIPEPETYALMAAGLGIMGFIGGRQKH